MNKFLLAVDIGNTTIECGVFDKATLLTSWRLSSTVSRTPDEYWQSTTFFCREVGIDPKNLSYLAVSSVVPDHARSFMLMGKARFDESPLDISVQTCPFLVVRYRNPSQVGADRLCNAYAGYHYYKGPLIVVDFGTAVTLDVVAEDGAYLGGVIVPGPRAAAGLLHSRTAQLPHVSLKFPDSVIGDTTENAISTGLTWGLVDMIDGLIGRVKNELGKNTRIVATGGFAKPYAKRSRMFGKIHEDLVLEGVRLLHERVRGLA